MAAISFCCQLLLRRKRSWRENNNSERRCCTSGRYSFNRARVASMAQTQGHADACTYRSASPRLTTAYRRRKSRTGAGGGAGLPRRCGQVAARAPWLRSAVARGQR
ncbi:hypothetical protein KCP70_00910 [Salmonella enterica subsp. enterica]|nr:hypothetical protein KCP70_00910 [Salmonella enterica subsp. enterica]